MNTKPFIKKICFLLALLMCLGCLYVPTPAYAKTKISAPKLGKWKQEPINPALDGVTYTIRWKKVKGAKGYQVKYCERDWGEDSWYTWNENTKKCSASISFSSLYKFKVKVRAYKISKGKKIYSKWTSSKVMTMN